MGSQLSAFGQGSQHDVTGAFFDHSGTGQNMPLVQVVRPVPSSQGRECLGLFLVRVLACRFASRAGTRLFLVALAPMMAWSGFLSVLCPTIQSRVALQPLSIQQKADRQSSRKPLSSVAPQLSFEALIEV